MLWSMQKYIEAKLADKYGNCVWCHGHLTKVRPDQAFCTRPCKDKFWNYVKGRNKASHASYPGGYEQWKKDYAEEMNKIADQEIEKILGEPDEVD